MKLAHCYSQGCRLVGLALVCGIVATKPAGAASINYGVVAGAQDFNTAANWVGGVVPGSGDLPIISSVDGIVDYPYIDTSVSVQRFLIAEFTGNTGGLELRSGGNLTTSSASAHYVGARGTGHLRILDGATLNINGSMNVGWGDTNGRGTGTITQSGGTYNGTSASTSLILGNSAATSSFPASMGTYNMTGGEALLGGSVTVGNAGNGAFNLSGGKFTTDSFFRIGVGSASVGVVNMSGGKLNTYNYFQVGRDGNGSFIQTGGDLAVSRSDGEAMVIAPFANSTGLYQISGGTLSVTTGSGLGSVAIGVASGNANGTFKVIGSQPIITLHDNYIQRPGATLAFDITDGISPVNVGDNVTLAGILDVNFTATPLVGQQFTIMNYGGSLAGVFDTFDDLVDSPAGSNSVKLSINYGTGVGSSIVLTVDSIGTTASGDFDGDGDVDGADFVAWQTNFPMTSGANSGNGDADGDNDVDGADFATWQEGFGTSSGVTPVPEPTSMMLAVVACVITIARGALARNNSSVKA